jgi:hypothetical protein
MLHQIEARGAAFVLPLCHTATMLLHLPADAVLPHRPPPEPPPAPTHQNAMPCPGRAHGSGAGHKNIPLPPPKMTPARGRPPGTRTAAPQRPAFTPPPSHAPRARPLFGTPAVRRAAHLPPFPRVPGGKAPAKIPRSGNQLSDSINNLPSLPGGGSRRNRRALRGPKAQPGPARRAGPTGPRAPAPRRP